MEPLLGSNNAEGLASCSSLLRDTSVITDRLATLRQMEGPQAVSLERKLGVVGHKSGHGFQNFVCTKSAILYLELPFTKS